MKIEKEKLKFHVHKHRLIFKDEYEIIHLVIHAVPFIFQYNFTQYTPKNAIAKSLWNTIQDIFIFYPSDASFLLLMKAYEEEYTIIVNIPNRDTIISCKSTNLGT